MRRELERFQWRTVKQTFSRLLTALERERIAAMVLVVAMAAYAGLTLYLTRGTTFTADETQIVAGYEGLDLGSLLAPQNAHLIVAVRLLYGADLDLFGGSYLLIRIVEIIGVIAIAGLAYSFLQRRVGAAVALVPSIILLFFGSSKIVISPLGIAPNFAIAAGLGALVALERRDLRGDLIACGLLIISLATYSIGIAFLVGAAVWILLENDRRRHAWAVLVPLALYGAWFLWARKFDQGAVEVASLLLIPNFALESLAAVSGALAGVNYPFGNELVGPEEVALGWGRILAALAIAFVVVMALRRPPSKLFWGLAAALLALWALLALSPGFLRTPAEARYLLPGAVLLILACAEVARGTRISRPLTTTILLVGLLALGSNLVQFKDAGAELRQTADNTRAVVAMYELAGDNGNPEYSRSYDVPVSLGDYRLGAARNGSYALPLGNLPAQPESLRALADETLAEALNLSVALKTPTAGDSCERIAAGDAVKSFELPPGGAVLRSAFPAAVSVGRFGSAATVGVGETPGGQLGGLLQIPTDADPTPWIASIATPGAVSLCALAAGSEAPPS